MKRTITVVLSMLVLASLVLTACGATPTQAPASAGGVSGAAGCEG